MSKQEVATKEESSMPSYLDGVKKESFGNLDSSDLIIPRIKLMQKTSPELDVFESLRAGEFYHTVLEESIGKEVVFIPMRVVKSYVIWDIRDSETPILARSSDAKVWNDEYQGAEILYRTKNDKKGRKIVLGENVIDGGLTAFGTSDPNDERSAPIATLTYDWMIWVVGVGPMMLTLSRSGVKPSRNLYGKIEMRNTPAHSQRYEMSSRIEGEGTESYLVYTFKADGFAEEADFNSCADFLKNSADKTVRSSDEGDDSVGGGKTGKSKPKGKLRNDL